MVDPVEYDTYFVPAMFEPWSRELIKRAQVWKGDRVLDVATGTGIVACRIAGTGAKVTGVDISQDRLAQAAVRAREESVPVTWHQRDAIDLRFPKESFDLVTCQQGLQFVGDHAAAAREMRQVLAPGGRAVIACWAPATVQPVHALVDAIATRRFGRGYGVHFSLGVEAVLRKLLTDAKFFAIAIETVIRKVRFPEPSRFVTLTLASLAREAACEDQAVIAAAIGETMEAVAPFIIENELEMMVTSLIAVARVPTK